MQEEFVSFRRRLLVRTGVLLLVTQSLTEFVDSAILHRFGLAYGGFMIHLVKVLVTAIILIPILALWLKDYSDLRDAEKHRREEREDFQSLFEHNPDMVVLYSLDGHYQDANPAFLRRVGRSMEQLRESDPFALVDEKHSKELKERFQLAVQGEPQFFVTEQLLRTGERVYLDVTYFPIYRNQVPVGIYVITRDVTEEKTAKRELNEAQAVMNAFIEHSTDAISIVNASGTVLQVNPAWERLYGWSANEIVGKPASSADSSLVQSVAADRQAVSADLSVCTRLGNWVPVSISVAPIFSTDGHLFGVSCITKDLTDRLETEELIRRSEKLAVSGKLAAGMAHEIRNPLAAIRGFLQLMQERPDSRYLEVLLKEVDHIDQITNEFLMLAKPQASKIEEVDIGATIQEVMLLMQSEANFYGVVLSEHHPFNIPVVQGVKGQLKQVFINLIKNAIEAQPEGGYVNVSAQVNGEYLAVEVRDGGPGMSTETISKLGEPFYTTKGRGSGLGLMVSFNLIQTHGGEVVVESQLGKGSRFVVSLPIPGQRNDVLSEA